MIEIAHREIVLLFLSNGLRQPVKPHHRRVAERLALDAAMRLLPNDQTEMRQMTKRNRSK